MYKSKTTTQIYGKHPKSIRWTRNKIEEYKWANEVEMLSLGFALRFTTTIWILCVK